MKIGYARVSTSDQKIEPQIRLLKNEGCEVIYEEKISSVKKRPQLDLMFQHLKKGDHVIVTKLDRIGRSLKHILDMKAYFEANEIGFTILKDNIDTTTTVGRLLFNMLAAIAEFERELIVERINSGIENAKRLGRIGGRPSGISQETINKALATKAISDAHPELSIKMIIERAGVTRPTFYRHLKIARDYLSAKE